MHIYAITAIPSFIFFHFVFKALNKSDPYAREVLKANSRFFLSRHCHYLTAQKSVKAKEFQKTPRSINKETVWGAFKKPTKA